MPTFANGTPMGTVRQLLNNTGLRKNNYVANRAPLVSDGVLQGYEAGSRWLWGEREWLFTGSEWIAVGGDGAITPQMFGAVGDGVADDTAAVQAWAAAGGTTLPAGRFRLMAALSFPRPLALSGVGMGATVLDWPAGAGSRGIVVTAGTDKTPTTIANLSLLTGGNAVGTALLIDYSGNISDGIILPRTAPRVRLRDVRMAGSEGVATTGWQHHADIVSALGVHASGCVIEGRGSGGTILSETGYRLRGGGIPVEFTLNGCWAYQVKDAVVTSGAEGVTVTDCNLVAINRGIAFSGLGVKPQCNVSDTHINAYAVCVDLDQCSQFNVHDNLLYSRSELVDAVVGVRISAACLNGRVSRNAFVRPGTNAMTGVQVAGADHVIEGNIFQSVPLGIDILATAVRAVERHNTYIGAVALRVSNASTTTTLETLLRDYSGSLDDLAGSVMARTTEAQVGGAATGLPPGATRTGSFVRTQVFDANAAHQEYRDHASGQVFTRIKAGGTWGGWSRLVAFAANGPRDLSGTGSPEGVVTAPVGSTFRRTDGGAGTSLYVKESGSGSTGWTAK